MTAKNVSREYFFFVSFHVNSSKEKKNPFCNGRTVRASSFVSFSVVWCVVKMIFRHIQEKINKPCSAIRILETGNGKRKFSVFCFRSPIYLSSMVCALCVYERTHNTTGNDAEMETYICGYNEKIKKGPNIDICIFSFCYQYTQPTVFFALFCSVVDAFVVAAAVIEHKNKIIPTFPKATVVESNTNFHFK